MRRALLPLIKYALLSFILYGCNRPKEVKVVESNSASYIAIAGPDTAWLDLTIKGQHLRVNALLTITTNS